MTFGATSHLTAITPTEIWQLSFSHSRAAPGGDRVVQKYVARPVTVDGAKFDLRVYLAVRSVSPVEAFLFTGWCVTSGTMSALEANSLLHFPIEFALI